MDLTFSAEFWALLPAFVVVTLVGAIETIGDGIAIQRISRRRPRATDFRLVQGALNADGMGNLLSGLLGGPPNTTYSTSISLAELTGVAARRVGVYVGAIFAALALSPKVTALLIAIPNPVGAAYVILLIGILFVQGMKLVVESGLNSRKAVVVGLSFWIGVGFQNQVIFADLLGKTWGTLLGNGMTAGVSERTARDNRRRRDFVPAVAALRLCGATPEIPRPRHHCGAGRAHALDWLGRPFIRVNSARPVLIRH